MGAPIANEGWGSSHCNGHDLLDLVKNAIIVYISEFAYFKMTQITAC